MTLDISDEICYNEGMDEKKVLKLKVLEKVAEALDETTEGHLEHGISHPHQTNPIYKKMASFSNSKTAGSKLEQWSINNLLR